MIKSFIAYPSIPMLVAETVREALRILHEEMRLTSFHGWEQNDIAGKFINDPIFSEIQSCDYMAADVTKLNFNVVYEIGYAIGLKRRIILCRNDSIDIDPLVKEVGLFDTLGYRSYTDGRTLSQHLTNVSDFKTYLIQDQPINTKVPIYVVLPKAMTDKEIHLLSKTKKAKLPFRRFDPDEQPRLSALEAIKNVSMSHGVIVPLIDATRKDAQVHNLRAAFVAGLSKGMNKELLLLQFGNDPVPLDYRDFVDYAATQAQIDEHMAEFAPSITERMVKGVPRLLKESANFLSKMSLGSSIAENEISDLQNYYIETFEYTRVLRGEVQIVVGRKGSGKTALFFQVRDKIRPDRSNLVLDLRPEGFQLHKFKDVVLQYLEQGTQEHTITAFWEYLLLLELCHKIIENDRKSHVGDSKLYQPYLDLQREFKTDVFISEGDFAERMLKLTEVIMDEFRRIVGNAKGGTRLATAELTNLIYKHNTNALRERIANYLGHKRSVWILFDNLDKGWPPRGVEVEDLLILRCLIEAMTKLQKYLSKKQTPCHGVVFLRNDVYEMLVENSTDRGKISKVTIDWTDQEYFRELLKRRIAANDLDDDESFDNVWQRICISHVKGEESAGYLIDRCLMRPRALIDLVSLCRSHAVTLNHARIEHVDIIEGEKTYSSELVENIGLEMRDVFPKIKPDVRNILYEFIGSSVRLNQSELHRMLANYKLLEEHWAQIIDLLLWWGFLGIVRGAEDVAYIHSVQYNMNHLRALVRKSTNGAIFYINPAFWAGLGIIA